MERTSNENENYPNLYRPQRSWAKVMFLQASVILSTGGGVCLSACWDTHPQEQTPPGSRHPLEQTPPGADTPESRHPLEQTPPRADTFPWEQTPPPGKQTPAYGQRAVGTHPTGMHSC